LSVSSSAGDGSSEFAPLSEEDVRKAFSMRQQAARSDAVAQEAQEAVQANGLPQLEEVQAALVQAWIRQPVRAEKPAAEVHPRLDGRRMMIAPQDGPAL
jgi:hypothetical protein